MEARAYSTLAVKSFDEDQRTFSGTATSPVADRVNDRIDPLGAKYRNPLVLLRAHDHQMPIGECTFGRPTKAGITFTAKIPKIEEPGLLRDRLEMAWGEVKHGLTRAVSIGFRPTKDPKPNELGGLDFPGVEIFELSTVSVPAHQLATIDQVKALDAAIRAGEAPSIHAESRSIEALLGTAHNEPEAQAMRDLLMREGKRCIKEAFEDPAIAAAQRNAEATGRMVAAMASKLVALSFALNGRCGARIAEIERRMDEPELAYAGVHQRALAYRRGQAVTHKGSLYIALKAAEPGDIPGETASWQMAVKAGRDGKDAR